MTAIEADTHAGPTATIVDAIAGHALSRPDATALVVTRGGQEAEVLTYSMLDRRARAFASHLRTVVPPGALVLLLMRSDAASVVALMACFYAGLPCAPLPLPPRNGSLRRLEATMAASDCGAVIVPEAAPHLAPILAGVPAVSEHDPLVGRSDPLLAGDMPSASGIALVQYTSGSTTEPKGVMLTHTNIQANLEMLRHAFRVDPQDRFASWLPLFHDMGLAMVLMPLHFGVPGVLMPPLSFVRRPELWLQLVDRSGATITGAPNFAYETCLRGLSDAQLADLDLSRLRLAFCGAEPVRMATMRGFAQRFASTGFRASALYPCYGMAETVTFVAGGHLFDDALARQDGGDPSGPVSCGSPAIGTTVSIVDPVAARVLPEGEVGEVWIGGPHVGKGYLGLPEATRSSFGAELASRPGSRHLRTGDLGFVVDGALTITGRLKDVIIHRGAKIHAADVEATVAACHPHYGDVGAAFAWAIGDQEAVVVVHEVGRRVSDPDQVAMLKAAGDAVALHHGVRLRDLVLVRAGSLPKTTSGKIRRDACRAHFKEGTLQTLRSAGATPHGHDRHTGPEIDVPARRDALQPRI